MLKNFFLDTESVGLYSPTILIQYYSGLKSTINREDVTIHNIWKEPINGSLELIEEICENNIIGFNLAHDWFHLSRTYGVLKELYPQNKPPTILDYHDVENETVCHDAFCLKPKGALDLMLYGRTHEFQATMNQKDIVIRRVPRLLAEILVKELETKIEIPKLYFAKREGKQAWKIKNLHLDTTKEITPTEMANIGTNNVKIDPNFVNIRLSFHPSTGLKPIMKYLLNKDIDLIENMIPFKRPIEHSWFPSSGKWLHVAPEHIFGWSNSQRRINYAKDDVVYLLELFNYFKSPYDSIGEDNSMLACMIGSLHWRGYNIDLNKIKKQIDIQEKLVKKYSEGVNFNSPKQVVTYLKECADPIEKMLIIDSKEETLFALKNNGSLKLVQRATQVLEGRHADKKLDLLKKLNFAKRLYVTFKVVGTKTNRMSGGSMEEDSYATTKGGSINPQGIKKGSDIRDIFLAMKLQLLKLCLKMKILEWIYFLAKKFTPYGEKVFILIKTMNIYYRRMVFQKMNKKVIMGVVKSLSLLSSTTLKSLNSLKFCNYQLKLCMKALIGLKKDIQVSLKQGNEFTKLSAQCHNLTVSEQQLSGKNQKNMLNLFLGLKDISIWNSKL